MKSKKTTHKKHDEQQKRKRWHWFVAGGITVLVASVIAGLLWFYSDRVLPSVVVGDTDVSNMTATQVRQTIEQQQEKLKVTFTDGRKSTTVPAKQLGVIVDVGRSVQEILQARRSGNAFANIQFWQTMQVPLVLRNDPGMLIDYAKKHFPSVFVNAKEPQLVYNGDAKRFDIKPGENGKGFDIKAFEQALPDLAKNPGNRNLPLTTAPTQPLISINAAKQAQKAINERLKLSLKFQHLDEVVQEANAADIASWAHFEPNTIKGTLTVTFDSAKIRQFLTDRVGSVITSPPIDRKVIVNPQTGNETVLQEGQPGRQLQHIDDLATEVLNTLKANKSLIKSVAVVEAPFKTVVLSASDNWVEVDLSNQRATLYMGDVAIQSFLISSGKAETPTRVGTFYVWLKRPSQTMTGTIAGDYFYLENVKWVSYFDGEEAFHGTYWHSNFGHPMSHGCINMTEADAKILYDFTPVGTRVVVHY